MKRRRPEESLHVAVARFLDAALCPPTWWTSIDHGAGKLSPRAGAMAKARGVRKGLPDVLVIHPSPSVLPSCIVIGIEIKAAKGRQSQEQREVDAAFDAAGARYRVCRSIEDVAAVLRANDIPLRARVAVAA